MLVGGSGRPGSACGGLRAVPVGTPGGPAVLDGSSGRSSAWGLFPRSRCVGGRLLRRREERIGSGVVRRSSGRLPGKREEEEEEAATSRGRGELLLWEPPPGR